MDGFDRIHDPDKYKRIPSLNQEKICPTIALI
jgi:hypothetical protein